MSNKAGILTIGDEILIGQIINTNAAWIGNEIRSMGMEITRTMTVGDNPNEILWGLNKVSEDNDFLIVTGGLGPTEDDRTKASIAHFFCDQLVFNEEVYQRAVDLLAKYGRKPKESQRRQCMLPSQAKIFMNDMGTAPGLYMESGSKHYFFLPGVPFEMKHLMKDRLIEFINDDLLKQKVHLINKTILTAGVGETVVEDKISKIVRRFPEGLSIAYLPGKGIVRLRLSWNGANRHDGTRIIEEFSSSICKVLADAVYGFDDDTLENVVGKILRSRNLQLVTAESCTGGRIASRLVSIPGASDYFKGGAVTYSNALKEAMLGVNSETLQKYGAVSRACVKEMAIGAINSMQGDIGISISGIAGPDGGTIDKPVGTVYICIASNTHHKIVKYRGTKDRNVNLDYFTNHALNMLRLFLLDM